MDTYKNTLEKAKKIIEGLVISPEDKALLLERVAGLSLTSMEAFVLMLEKDPSEISVIIEKMHQWIAAGNNPDEKQKVIEDNKRELLGVIAQEG